MPASYAERVQGPAFRATAVQTPSLHPPWLQPLCVCILETRFWQLSGNQCGSPPIAKNAFCVHILFMSLWLLGFFWNSEEILRVCSVFRKHLDTDLQSNPQPLPKSNEGLLRSTGAFIHASNGRLASRLAILWI